MTNIPFTDALLQLTVDQGLLTRQQAADVAEEHADSGKPVRALLLDDGYLTEDQLLEAIAGYLGTRVVNLPALDIPPPVVHSVPASVARMYSVVPVDAGIERVQLAVADLLSPEVMDELAFVLTRDVSVVLARAADVRTCINQFYGDESDSVSEMLSTLESEFEKNAGDVQIGETEDEKGIEEQAGSAPVIRYVNLVLYSAVKERASDIHFEPFEKEFKIRYRVDGALYEMAPPPKHLALPVCRRRSPATSYSARCTRTTPRAPSRG